VFTDPADLARYCRKAKEHALIKLERWAELAEADDDAFEPLLDASYDLTAPSTKAGRLLRELVAFCDLTPIWGEDAGDTADPIDEERWTALVAEVETCLNRP